MNSYEARTVELAVTVVLNDLTPESDSKQKPNP